VSKPTTLVDYITKRIFNSSPRTRVLIFNCTHGRSGSQLLGALLNVMKSRLALHYVGAQSEGTLTRGFFDHVVFCPNVTYADGTFKGGKRDSCTFFPSDL